MKVFAWYTWSSPQKFLQQATKLNAPMPWGKFWTSLRLSSGRVPWSLAPGQLLGIVWVLYVWMVPLDGLGSGEFLDWRIFCGVLRHTLFCWGGYHQGMLFGVLGPLWCMHGWCLSGDIHIRKCQDSRFHSRIMHCNKMINVIHITCMWFWRCAWSVYIVQLGPHEIRVSFCPLCATTEACVEGTSCNDFLFISLQQMQQQCTTGTTCFLMERSAWPRLLRGLMPAPTITMYLQLSWLPRLLLGLCLIWEQHPLHLKLPPW